MKLVNVYVVLLKQYVMINKNGNENKCRCECKEDLIDKLIWDKGYIWNPSTCTGECDKYCGTEQYLDYQNYVCRKKKKRLFN